MVKEKLSPEKWVKNWEPHVGVRQGVKEHMDLATLLGMLRVKGGNKC